MGATIESRIYRFQRKMDRLLAASETPVTGFNEGEQALGFYQNQGEDGLAFTSEGVHFNKGPLIRYRDLADIRVSGEKNTAAHLELILSNGSVEVIEINGGSGRLRDVWEILRLLRRIIETVKSSSAPGSVERYAR